jgi:predicted DNA-binding protein
LKAVRLTQAQADQLKALSDSTGRSESELIREAIMALLGVYHAEASDVLAETPHEGVAPG